MDIDSKINLIWSSFAKKLGLSIKNTDIDTPKIDGNRLEIFKIVIVSFSLDSKDVKS